MNDNGAEKCVRCQFYDRRGTRSADGQATMWGQCRRHSPRLNPLAAKAHVIEGVWPTVRDDDWCGEWKFVPVRAAPRAAETAEPVAAPATTRVLRPLPAVADATVAAGHD